jgi:integral membrane protein (TIGR01906 family)
VKDETPARAKSAAPQPEPFLDTSGDSEEPAFSWLTPAGKGASGAEAEGTSTAEGPPGPVGSSRVSSQADTHEPDSTINSQPESRAGRKAAEAAAEPSGGAAATGAAADSVTVPPPDSEGSSGHSSSPVFKEPLPTSALHVRPPEEEVARRNAERESAANAKPVAPRVMQVLLAIFFPVVLLVLAVRAVTSPLFLWVEYNRPGFPGDGYGFSTDDRMTFGSYAVDYLTNWAGPRYLGDLVHRSGDKLFKDGEVSHMADVKAVILSTFGAGALLLLLGLIAVLYLRKRSRGGVRRGLFAGSIVTLVLILGLGTLAVLGWQQFFTEFHRIFFADGSWTFSLDDTLIRLFPGQFWIDAGLVIAGLVLLAALVTLILTWPTRRRRGLLPEEPAAENQA